MSHTHTSIQAQVAQAAANFPASAGVAALGTPAGLVASGPLDAPAVVLSGGVAPLAPAVATTAPSTAPVTPVVASVAPDVGAAVVADPAANPTVNTPAAPVVVLTRSEQLTKEIETIEGTIEALTKKLEVKKQQLGSVDLIASITEGAVIKVKLGRAETTREVDGTVTGIKETPQGNKYKVLVGTGFDATTEVITEAQIISVVR